MIYLAADHRGFLRKEEVKEWLGSRNLEFVDVGNKVLDPEDDEVDFVKMAVEMVAASAESSGEPRGIFFCGSGVMVDVAANKFPRIRSCLGFEEEEVRAARNDDDVNVLSLAADLIDLEKTIKLVEVFLETPFSGEERYKRRLEKLEHIDG